MKKVYGCEVSRDDHYVRIEGGKFNPDEFAEFPERYVSAFSHMVNLCTGHVPITETFLNIVFCYSFFTIFCAIKIILKENQVL